MDKVNRIRFWLLLSKTLIILIFISIDLYMYYWIMLGKSFESFENIIQLENLASNIIFAVITIVYFVIFSKIYYLLFTRLDYRYYWECTKIFYNEWLGTDLGIIGGKGYGKDSLGSSVAAVDVERLNHLVKDKLTSLRKFAVTI